MADHLLWGGRGAAGGGGWGRQAAGGRARAAAGGRHGDGACAEQRLRLTDASLLMAQSTCHTHVHKAGFKHAVFYHTCMLWALFMVVPRRYSTFALLGDERIVLHYCCAVVVSYCQQIFKLNVTVHSLLVYKIIWFWSSGSPRYLCRVWLFVVLHCLISWSCVCVHSLQQIVQNAGRERLVCRWSFVRI